MDLKYPDLLPVGLAAIVALAVIVHLALMGRARRGTAPVANSTALTHLPEYQRALRGHRIRQVLLTVSASLLAGAALVGAARPLDTSIERPQTRSRDIVLCLDISGSMAAHDAALINVFRGLVTDFEGERIGMVIFNASAVTVFPLTDDYDFINTELTHAHDALTHEINYPEFFAGTFNGRGTSLIGDGLTTCVQSFDRIDSTRARSVIFATDNHLAGRPLVALDEAGELAKARGVRVYGLNPEENGTDREAVYLRQVVQGTAGTYYAMADESAIPGIVAAVQAQEATVIDGSARALHTDNPVLPITLAGLGLLGVIGVSRRWRT
ncbi:MAG: VWA domain-containing protein [Dermatophilaceae bacterium]